MAGLTPKDREALSFLYELTEFRALKKLCAIKRAKVAELIIGTDTSTPGALQRIAMLQGQAYALEYLENEFQNIHKQQINKATAEKNKER